MNIDDHFPNLSGSTESTMQPRRYQTEALERAKEENTIVCMRTGSGKTHIAVMLLQYLSHLIRKPSQRISVFLAPTVCLVQQQAEVIKQDTDLKVGTYWGENVETWIREKWQAELNEFEVFVMTPEILSQNLRHCFMRIELIELLIFDECHHARKHHPYAEIMNEFYHVRRCDPTCKLPRIFGMTASLIDGKVERSGEGVANQLKKLEGLLHSKVYTVTDRVELDKVVPCPTEVKKYYDAPVVAGTTAQLSTDLRSLKDKCRGLLMVSISRREGNGDMGMTVMKKMLQNLEKLHSSLEYCLQELGLWCCCEAAEILLGRIKGNSDNDMEPENDCEAKCGKKAFLIEALGILKAALSKAVFLSENGEIEEELEPGLVSSKVQALIDVLKTYRNLENMRCIVFVERKITTQVLARFLSHFSCLSSLLRFHPLAGTHSGMDHVTRRLQHEAIEAFRVGKVNVLVSTSIGEEGLDIQSCSQVIRFDLPKTPCSLIQSRGRARCLGSTYIYLLERDNNEQLQLLGQFKLNEVFMSSQASELTGCLEVPETQELETFRVESTGASISTSCSVSLLHRYCAQLAHDRYYTPKPEFHFIDQKGGVKCRVLLPTDARVRQVEGRACVSQYQAKRVACLQACKQLYEEGALTDWLLLWSDEPEDPSPLSCKDTTAVKSQLEPHPTVVLDAFRGSWGAAATGATLHAYTLCFSPTFSDRSYVSFGLFLESNLGDEAGRLELELQLALRRLVKAQLSPSGTYKFDANQLRDAKLCQERLFSTVLDHNPGSKVTGNWSPSQLYLLLPLQQDNTIDWECVKNLISDMTLMSWNVIGCDEDNTKNGVKMVEKVDCGDFCELPDGYQHLNSSVNSLILTAPRSLSDREDAPGKDLEGGNSTTISEERTETEKLSVADCVSNIRELRLADGWVPVEFVLDSVVETVHNGYFYCVREMIGHMNADSPMAAKGKYSCYTHYFLEKHSRKLVHTKQPMLKAKRLIEVRNLQRTTNPQVAEELKAEAMVELPPELCRIRVRGLSCALANGVSLLPSFMHHLEGFLLAIQLRQTLTDAFPEAAKVSANTMLEAITTGQCLESFSLEGLELLGDAFLEYAVSVHLFLVHNDLNEGELSKRRIAIICNATLQKLGKEQGLASYIRDAQFCPSDWCAPGRPHGLSSAEGEEACESKDGILHPKSNIKKCSKKEGWLQGKTIADVVESLIGAHYIEGGSTAALSFMDWVGCKVAVDHNVVKRMDWQPGLLGDTKVVELEKLLSYSFQNKGLLEEALTHASCTESAGACYQRLEFLGDAVLDFLITEHFYLHSTNLKRDPGLLSDLRSAAVNNECFARVAVRHNLHLYLLHDSPALAVSVNQYVEFIKASSTASERCHGWEGDGGPKVLSDLVESLAGAVLVDSRFDLPTVWKVFKEVLRPLVTPATLRIEPTRELRELCQAEKFQGPDFTKTHAGNDLVLAHVTVHAKAEKITAQAKKKSGKSAEKRASIEMLGKLKERGFQHRRWLLQKALVAYGKTFSDLVDVTEQESADNKFDTGVKSKENQQAHYTYSSNAVPHEAMASQKGIHRGELSGRRAVVGAIVNGQPMNLAECVSNPTWPTISLPTSSIEVGAEKTKTPLCLMEAGDLIKKESSSQPRGPKGHSSTEYQLVLTSSAGAVHNENSNELMPAYERHNTILPRDLELRGHEPRAASNGLDKNSALGRLCAVMQPPESHGPNCWSDLQLIKGILHSGSVSLSTTTLNWPEPLPSPTGQFLDSNLTVPEEGHCPVVLPFQPDKQADLQNQCAAVETRMETGISKCSNGLESELWRKKERDLSLELEKLSEYPDIEEFLANISSPTGPGIVKGSADPVCPQKHVLRASPEAAEQARALCIAISDDRGDESFADDLNMGRGKKNYQQKGEARSTLNELCAKCKWCDPQYKCCKEGPRFRCVVTITCPLDHTMYTLEFTGETVSQKKGAMDLAADKALSWLRERRLL